MHVLAGDGDVLDVVVAAPGEIGEHVLHELLGSRRAGRQPDDGVPGQQLVVEDGLTIDEDAFAKDREFLRAMIKYEVDLALFSVQEARKNLIASDPQARFAMSVFPDAEKLTELARSKAASRD